MGRHAFLKATNMSATDEQLLNYVLSCWATSFSRIFYWLLLPTYPAEKEKDWNARAARSGCCAPRNPAFNPSFSILGIYVYWISIYHSRQLWLTLRLIFTKQVWSQGKVCPLCQALSVCLSSGWVNLACPGATFISSLLDLRQPLVQTICLAALVI